MPHDPVNEQVLLVAAAMDPKARARLVVQLPPDAFLVAEHVDLWIALTELERRRLEYSAATLRQLSGGRADTAYLDALCEQRTAPANIEHHVSMLEWDRVRAEAVRGPLADLLESLRDPGTPREKIQALARAVAGMVEKGTSTGLVRDAQALGKRALRLRRRRRVGAWFTERGRWAARTRCFCSRRCGSDGRATR